MEKEIYTPMERNLIKGAQALQDLNAALKLDLLLLELESSLGMMDGFPIIDEVKEVSGDGE